MNARPTPETNRECFANEGDFVTGNFARRLERQRDEYHRKACDIADERDRACERLAVVSLQLEDCKAQRDELLAALEAIKRRVPIMGSKGDYREGQLHTLEACSEVASAAIAAVKGGK